MASQRSLISPHGKHTPSHETETEQNKLIFSVINSNSFFFSVTTLTKVAQYINICEFKFTQTILNKVTPLYDLRAGNS